jgi:phosphatidylglycerophosphatase A
MNRIRIVQNLCTLGYIGYLPGGGTWGSLFFLPCAIALRLSLSYLAYVVTVCTLSLIAYAMITAVLPLYTESDPAQIVIDECIGMLFALCIPINVYSVILACVLFRIFDITKWFGIGRLESYPGAFGILLDDIAAGILAMGLVRIASVAGVV